MSSIHNRKLVAILFADIVGYTSLMQVSEQQALNALQKFKAQLETQVPVEKGEIIQFYGDGCLCTFDSSVNAVNCAKKLQLAFKNAPEVPVRIGLHAGEVVFKEDNAFGDAINIASRIESMGVPGSILISSNIRNQIKNKPEFELVALGRFEFKNVLEGMTVYALKNDGLIIPKKEEIKGKLKTSTTSSPAKKTAWKWLIPLFLLVFIGLGTCFFSQKETTLNIVADGQKIPQFDKTIAILPFRDLSPKQDQVYFADGIVEAIRSKLAQVGNLRVTSMTSVLGYRDHPKSISEITKELNVAHILEGTIYRDKDRVRVIAQLINTETDEHIWAETYDEEIEDIFQVQTTIANNVTKALQAKLTPQEAVRLNTIINRDINAYDVLLSAKNALTQYRKTEDIFYLNETIEKSHRAIQMDSLLDQAYVGVALGWYMKYFLGSEEPTLDSAYYYLERGIQINSYNDFAYALKSQLDFLKRDFESSKNHAETALNLSPSNSWALLTLGHYYGVIEQTPEKQVPLFLKAIAIEPQNQTNPESSLYNYLNLAHIYILADLFQDAETILNKTKILYPTALQSYNMLKLFSAWKRDFETAIKYAQLIVEKTNNFQDYEQLGAMYYMAGNYTEAEKNYRKVLTSIKEGKVENPDSWIFRHRLAAILWNTGRKAEAKILFDEHIQKCLKDYNETLGSQAYDLAGAYAFLGEKEKAYEWLEKVNYQNWIYNWMRIDPLFDSLREEDRFKRIIGKWQEQIRRFRKKLKSMEVDGELIISIEDSPHF